MNTSFFVISEIVLCISWVIWSIRNYKYGKKGLCVITVIGALLWGLYAIRDIGGLYKIREMILEIFW